MYTENKKKESIDKRDEQKKKIDFGKKNGKALSKTRTCVTGIRILGPNH